MREKVIWIVVMIPCLLFVAWFILGNQEGKPKQNQIKKYDIIIYGGGVQGVAAALKASETTNQKANILMVVPENQLGSIMTSGGQNLFDVRNYTSKHLPKGLPENYPYAQGGSMKLFYEGPSIVFSPKLMAEHLYSLILEKRDITVLFGHDIEKVYPNQKKDSIDKIRIYPLIKVADKSIYDISKPIVATAKTYIDASETGKLTRISGMFNGVVGRGDVNPDNKQMAATLMFKIKNIDIGKVEKDKASPITTYYSTKGSLGILGGYEIRKDKVFIEYNKSNERFRIKPYNGGEDGYAGIGNQNENTQIWMNLLLIYDVDGRKTWQDKIQNNGNYPHGGGISPEDAKEMAIKEIRNPNFLNLIRKLPGLKKAEIVLDENNLPVVGDTLYLRETIHSSNPDGSFALTKEQSYEGKDKDLFERRIGLGYYNFDSNTYDKEESLTEDRNFNPWYVPYDVLKNPSIKNLLIPGYAANIDSFTWRAMRVYPNLVVLGDGAGVAAGLEFNQKFNLENPTKKEFDALHKQLETENVILNK